MPVHDDWVTWCHACNWNVAGSPRTERPKTSLARLLDRIVAASGDHLAADLKHRDELAPRLTPGMISAYAIAAGVQLTALALIGGAIVLAVIGFPNPFILFAAAAMLGFAALIRPRLGKPPGEGRLDATEAPELQRLVAEIAAALGTAPADVIVVGNDFNASWAVVGLRRRRVLGLGLPLLAVLGPQERVALIAHELAHARNGDTSHGLVVASALNTLSEIYLSLLPGETTLSYGQLALIDAATRALLWVVAQPVKWLYVLELHLLLRDMQRAEYLADALAASVSGTAAVVALHDALLAKPVALHAVQMAAHNRLAPDLLATALADAMKAIPGRERERRRRAAALEKTRLGATHPPTAMRIDLLESRPHASATVELDDSRSHAIDVELTPRLRDAGQQLIDEYRASLYR